MHILINIAAKFGFVERELDGFKRIYKTMVVKVVQTLTGKCKMNIKMYTVTYMETAWLSCALISA